MSVSLITWGRFFDKNGNKITVPAPSTDGAHVPWLWDFLASQASALANVGFDSLQLPPASKALGGAGVGCDGYGVYCRRDLGDQPQQGSTPTRYGSAESLRRLCAVAHANGLNIFLDVVLHQLMGENGGPGVFKYVGSDGKMLNGRGRTAPGWFRGNTGNNDPVPPFCAEDGVPNAYFDYAFGRELSYQNCNPNRVTINDALEYGNWLFRTLDGDGARFDDVKGTWAPFVAEFMNSRAMAGKPFYSEFFDANPATLNWWATSSPMNGRSGVEDFTNHFAIQSVCAGGSARLLNGAGYTTWNSGLSYVFVDNPDTDTSYGEAVTTAKLLGYAFLATIPSRQLLVYGKDYYSGSVWPGAYGLKPFIDNLIYINQTYAYGNTYTQFVDDDVIVINRDGNGGSIGNSPGLLTALNFDTYNRRTITCPTTFGSNCHLHDLTGRHGDIWTDNGGNATFTIPSNAWEGGQSYLCFVPAGHDRAIVINRRSTTQLFEGSPDMSIGPATAAGAFCARIWPQAGTELRLNKESGDGVRFEVTDASGETILDRSIWSGKVANSGWHTITAFAPSDEPVSYTVTATYTAPKVFELNAVAAKEVESL